MSLKKKKKKLLETLVTCSLIYNFENYHRNLFCVCVCGGVCLQIEHITFGSRYGKENFKNHVTQINNLALIFEIKLLRT